jgi:hypothetical protein
VNNFVPLALTVILVSLSALHVYWGLGLSTPSVLVIPEAEGEPLFVPSRVATFAVAAALAVAALVAASRGQLALASGPGSIVHWAAIAAGGAFLLRAIGEFKYVGFFPARPHSRIATIDTGF